MSSFDSSLQLLSASLETSPARAGGAAELPLAGEAPAAELVFALDRDLRVLAVNSAMLACLGREEAAVLNRPLGEVLDPELAPIGLAAFAARSSGRQVVIVESIAPKPGAVPVRYKLSFVPVEAGGGIDLICAARPAITEVGVDAAMLEASNREQVRLGRDLHDTLGQELVTTLLLLSGLEKQIADRVPDLLPRTREIRSAVTQALESMRSVVRGLVPSGLEAGGLCRILAELAARCGQDGRLRFEFSGPDELPPLPGGAAEHIYRFAQEAVANIVRHARASSVGIRLVIEDGDLVLTVTDDGAGFDPEAAEGQGGMGLRSMRYRAQSLGGRLAVESNPIGTCVVLRVPLSPP
jgi:signal transduction histidine kinase